MIGQTVKIGALCECGDMAVRQVNQYINYDELCWDAEFFCVSCGSYRCEHAGPGLLAFVAWHVCGAARERAPVTGLPPVLVWRAENQQGGS
ncbi:hypothetical protein GCM10018790_64880 [Kitasatospora xanthocidica]|uniref:hypothetical protein n=1 Tax=Kitasatospora xanthocidica TaxID=83382 RepID=UPI0016737F5F|nr:hypothetical protein [Kitasatospora xanthocidica]GHF77782.1 hypothetical protein GCM10018790_64880 [Kitasatospora xanthocidica]